MVINNPETGETHRVTKGNSVFFQKDTWHHAFNYSNDYLQVLEFFSPPPITGTSGIYAKKKTICFVMLFSPVVNTSVLSSDSIEDIENKHLNITEPKVFNIDDFRPKKT